VHKQWGGKLHKKAKGFERRVMGRTLGDAGLKRPGIRLRGQHRSVVRNILSRGDDSGGTRRSCPIEKSTAIIQARRRAWGEFPPGRKKRQNLKLKGLGLKFPSDQFLRRGREQKQGSKDRRATTSKAPLEEKNKE